MFASKVIILSTLASLTMLTTASPVLDIPGILNDIIGSSSTTTTGASAPTSSTPANQCATGQSQCCNDVKSADDPNAAPLLQALGITVEDPTSLVGLGCSALPITGCQDATPVCCENNSFNGVVNLGCTSVNA